MAGFAIRSLLADYLGNPFTRKNPVFTEDQHEAELLTALKALRVNTEGVQQTYSSGFMNVAPANNANDLAFVGSQFEDKTISIKRVTISGYCTAGGASIDVLLQRSPNGGSGTILYPFIAKHDMNDVSSTGYLGYYTTLRGIPGNPPAPFITNSRPIIRQGKLLLGTQNSPGVLEWTFGNRSGKGVTIRSLVEWMVVSLAGQALPAGTALSLDIEWTEERQKRVLMVGDSTTSNANFMFQYLYNQPRVNSQIDLRNYGSNGYRAIDVLMNTNGVTYPLSNILSALPESYAALLDQLIICLLINDYRQGATSQAQGISILDALIHVIKNGCVAGQSWTSTRAGGAGTTFTWTQTMTGNKSHRIILWGPNPIAADDPGNVGWLVLTGQFAGLTHEQAANKMNGMLYDSYQAFVGDPRVEKVIQKQDMPEYGKVAKTVAASGYHTDTLHPNAGGQKLQGQQILSTVLS